MPASHLCLVVECTEASKINGTTECNHQPTFLVAVLGPDPCFLDTSKLASKPTRHNDRHTLKHNAEG